MYFSYIASTHQAYPKCLTYIDLYTNIRTDEIPIKACTMPWVME